MIDFHGVTGWKSHPAIACAHNYRYHRIGTVAISIGPTLTNSGGSIKRKNKLIEDSSARRSESSVIGYIWALSLHVAKERMLELWALDSYSKSRSREGGWGGGGGGRRSREVGITKQKERV